MRQISSGPYINVHLVPYAATFLASGSADGKMANNPHRVLRSGREKGHRQIDLRVVPRQCLVKQKRALRAAYFSVTSLLGSPEAFPFVFLEVIWI